MDAQQDVEQTLCGGAGFRKCLGMDLGMCLGGDVTLRTDVAAFQ
jgi:hypothetical protein